MTSSILPPLQQLQPAVLVSAMVQAVVWVGCSVIKQQRYILKCQLCEIKAWQNKIEQHFLSQYCLMPGSSNCVSREDLQSAAFKHIGVKENLKALTTSGFAKNQELVAQILQIGSAICQVLNPLLRDLMKSAGTLTATFSSQLVRGNSYEPLSLKQILLW